MSLSITIILYFKHAVIPKIPLYHLQLTVSSIKRLLIMNDSVLHIYYCRVITFNEILSQCPDRSSTKWYNDCMIRYSIINFLGSSRTPTWDYLSNPLNTTNPVQFEKILGNLMNNLSTRAAFEPRTGMFATGEANLSSPSTLYGLVQCMGDISPGDCNRCLGEAISQLPKCCVKK